MGRPPLVGYRIYVVLNITCVYYCSMLFPGPPRIVVRFNLLEFKVNVNQRVVKLNYPSQRLNILNVIKLRIWIKFKNNIIHFVGFYCN